MTRTALGGGGLHLFWYVFPLALLPYLVLAWPLLNTVAGASAYALITALGGAARLLHHVSAYKRQRKQHAVTCERRTRDVDSWSDSE